MNVLQSYLMVQVMHRHPATKAMGPPTRPAEREAFGVPPSFPMKQKKPMLTNESSRNPARQFAQLIGSERRAAGQIVNPWPTPGQGPTRCQEGRSLPWPPDWAGAG